MKKMFLLLLSLSGLLTTAQTTIELLPNSGTCRHSVAIDAGDTIWTGSNQYGLQKYFNGTVTSYTISNSGISDNRCATVCVDSTGRIWCGGNNGISIYDHSAWINYNTTNSGLPDDS